MNLAGPVIGAYVFSPVCLGHSPEAGAGGAEGAFVWLFVLLAIVFRDQLHGAMQQSGLCHPVS